MFSQQELLQRESRKLIDFRAEGFKDPAVNVHYFVEKANQKLDEYDQIFYFIRLFSLEKYIFYEETEKKIQHAIKIGQGLRDWLSHLLSQYKKIVDNNFILQEGEEKTDKEFIDQLNNFKEDFDKACKFLRIFEDETLSHILYHNLIYSFPKNISYVKDEVVPFLKSLNSPLGNEHPIKLFRFDDPTKIPEKDIANAELENTPILLVKPNEEKLTKDSKYLLYTRDRYDRWDWTRLSDKIGDETLKLINKDSDEIPPMKIGKDLQGILFNYHNLTIAWKLQVLHTNIIKYQDDLKAAVIKYKHDAEILKLRLRRAIQILQTSTDPGDINLANDTQTSLDEFSKEIDKIDVNNTESLVSHDLQSCFAPITGLIRGLHGTENAVARIINNKSHDEQKKYYLESARELMGSEWENICEKASAIKNKILAFKKSEIPIDHDDTNTLPNVIKVLKAKLQTYETELDRFISCKADPNLSNIQQIKANYQEMLKRFQANVNDKLGKELDPLNVYQDSIVKIENIFQDMITALKNAHNYSLDVRSRLQKIKTSSNIDDLTSHIKELSEHTNQAKQKAEISFRKLLNNMPPNPSEKDLIALCNTAKIPHLKTLEQKVSVECFAFWEKWEKKPYSDEDLKTAITYTQIRIKLKYMLKDERISNLTSGEALYQLNLESDVGKAYFELAKSLKQADPFISYAENCLKNWAQSNNENEFNKFLSAYGKALIIDDKAAINFANVDPLFERILQQINVADINPEKACAIDKLSFHFWDVWVNSHQNEDLLKAIEFTKKRMEINKKLNRPDGKIQGDFDALYELDLESQAGLAYVELATQLKQPYPFISRARKYLDDFHKTRDQQCLLKFLDEYALIVKIDEASASLPFFPLLIANANQLHQLDPSACKSQEQKLALERLKKLTPQRDLPPGHQSLAFSYHRDTDGGDEVSAEALEEQANDLINQIEQAASQRKKEYLYFQAIKYYKLAAQKTKTLSKNIAYPGFITSNAYSALYELKSDKYQHIDKIKNEFYQIESMIEAIRHSFYVLNKYDYKNVCSLEFIENIKRVNTLVDICTPIKLAEKDSETIRLFNSIDPKYFDLKRSLQAYQKELEALQQILIFYEFSRARSMLAAKSSPAEAVKILHGGKKESLEKDPSRKNALDFIIFYLDKQIKLKQTLAADKSIKIDMSGMNEILKNVLINEIATATKMYGKYTRKSARKYEDTIFNESIQSAKDISKDKNLNFLDAVLAIRQIKWETKQYLLKKDTVQNREEREKIKSDYKNQKNFIDAVNSFFVEYNKLTSTITELNSKSILIDPKLVNVPEKPVLYGEIDQLNNQLSDRSRSLEHTYLTAKKNLSDWLEDQKDFIKYCEENNAGLAVNQIKDEILKIENHINSYSDAPDKEQALKPLQALTDSIQFFSSQAYLSMKEQESYQHALSNYNEILKKEWKAEWKKLQLANRQRAEIVGNPHDNWRKPWDEYCQKMLKDMKTKGSDQNLIQRIEVTWKSNYNDVVEIFHNVNNVGIEIKDTENPTKTMLKEIKSKNELFKNRVTKAENIRAKYLKQVQAGVIKYNFNVINHNFLDKLRIKLGDKVYGQKYKSEESQVISLPDNPTLTELVDLDIKIKTTDQESEIIGIVKFIKLMLSTTAVLDKNMKTFSEKPNLPSYFLNTLNKLKINISNIEKTENNEMSVEYLDDDINLARERKVKTTDKEETSKEKTSHPYFDDFQKYLNDVLNPQEMTQEELKDYEIELKGAEEEFNNQIDDFFGVFDEFLKLEDEWKTYDKSDKKVEPKKPKKPEKPKPVKTETLPIPNVAIIKSTEPLKPVNLPITKTSPVKPVDNIPITKTSTQTSVPSVPVAIDTDKSLEPVKSGPEPVKLVDNIPITQASEPSVPFVEPINIPITQTTERPSSEPDTASKPIDIPIAADSPEQHVDKVNIGTISESPLVLTKPVDVKPVDPKSVVIDEKPTIQPIINSGIGPSIGMVRPYDNNQVKNNKPIERASESFEPSSLFSVDQEGEEIDQESEESSEVCEAGPLDTDGESDDEIFGSARPLDTDGEIEEIEENESKTTEQPLSQVSEPSNKIPQVSEPSDKTQTSDFIATQNFVTAHDKVTITNKILNQPLTSTHTVDHNKPEQSLSAEDKEFVPSKQSNAYISVTLAGLNLSEDRKNVTNRPKQNDPTPDDSTPSTTSPIGKNQDNWNFPEVGGSKNQGPFPPSFTREKEPEQNSWNFPEVGDSKNQGPFPPPFTREKEPEQNSWNFPEVGDSKNQGPFPPSFKREKEPGQNSWNFPEVGDSKNQGPFPPSFTREKEPGQNNWNFPEVGDSKNQGPFPPSFKREKEPGQNSWNFPEVGDSKNQGPFPPSFKREKEPGQNSWNFPEVGESWNRKFPDVRENKNQRLFPSSFQREKEHKLPKAGPPKPPNESLISLIFSRLSSEPKKTKTPSPAALPLVADNQSKPKPPKEPPQETRISAPPPLPPFKPIPLPNWRSVLGILNTEITENTEPQLRADLIVNLRAELEKEKKKLEEEIAKFESKESIDTVIERYHRGELSSVQYFTQVQKIEQEQEKNDCIQTFINRCQKDLLEANKPSFFEQIQNWLHTFWPTMFQKPKNPLEEDPVYLKTELVKIIKSRWALERLNNQTDEEKKSLSKLKVDKRYGKTILGTRNRILQAIFSDDINKLNYFLNSDIANSFKKHSASFNLSLDDLQLVERYITKVNANHPKDASTEKSKINPSINPSPKFNDPKPIISSVSSNPNSLVYVETDQTNKNNNKPSKVLKTSTYKKK